jgi:hypothetical protein
MTLLPIEKIISYTALLVLTASPAYAHGGQDAMIMIGIPLILYLMLKGPAYSCSAKKKIYKEHDYKTGKAFEFTARLEFIMLFLVLILSIALFKNFKYHYVFFPLFNIGPYMFFVGLVNLNFIDIQPMKQGEPKMIFYLCIVPFSYILCGNLLFLFIMAFQKGMF